MSFYGEHEDIVAPLRAEISSLREELQRLRLGNEAKEREAEMLLAESLRLKRECWDLRKQVQSWADQADEEVRLLKLRQQEREACDL